MMIFYFLLNIGVMLLLAAAVLVVPVIPAMRTGRRWISAHSRRSNSVRLLETVQLAIGLVVLGVLWTFESQFTWPPAAIAESVESIRSLNIWTLATGAILGTAALFVTWRFSTVAGLLGLILIGGAALFAFSIGIDTERSKEYSQKYRGIVAAGSESPAAQPEPPETRIRFEMIDQLAGADLWINGVELGKTPIEITARELLSKVPDWSNDEKTQMVYSQPENKWTDSRGRTLRLWGWSPLHFKPHIERSTNLYFKVELNGVRGFSELIQQTHKNPGTQDELIRVELDTVFPQWDDEIETLLDRARLNDYATDESWQAAFESYGEFALKQLERGRTSEPRLALIQGTDPALHALLRNLNDSDSAWQLLMKNEDEARRRHSYDSGSANGLAVDQLVPLLNPERLVQHALELLRSANNPESADSGGTTSWPDGRFATWNGHGSQHGEEVGLWPVAQAVWRLDQALDAATAVPRNIAANSSGNQVATSADTSLAKAVYEKVFAAIDPSADNLVEREITPEVLRMSYENISRLKYAEILGGSAYESFLLRNDWHTPATDSFNGESIGDHENYVNQWFCRLMRLPTPLGEAFRNWQSSRLLEIARRGLSPFSMSGGSLSAELNFLFLDRQFTSAQPSLAMKFWPDLKAVTAGIPRHSAQEAFKIRWEYLGRIWPESTPAMFIGVFDDAARNSDHVFLQKFPDSMPLDGQFQVLMATIRSQQEQVAKLPRSPGDDSDYQSPRQKYLRLIASLREMLYSLPCEQAAAQLLEDLKAEPDHSWHSRISLFLKFDTTHEDLVRLIAVGDDPKLQHLILPAIQNHPIPGRVELLDQLLTSPDETVRTEAAAVKKYLDNLRTQPLPHRK